MINMNVIYALLTMVVLVLGLKLLAPILKKNNIYDEVKMALLLTGYAFRDEKVVAMTHIMLELVSNMEHWEVSSADKHEIALRAAYTQILEELGIELDAEAIDTMIRIAVAQLPATNK